MTDRDLLLGIDVGTGGCKALLVDSRGEVIAHATTEYPLSTPKPLWCEQDPEQWWSATSASIKKVLATANVEPGRVAGVGLTGQMHGLVLLDGHGEVLRPAILWNDQRCAEQCDEIHAMIGRETMIARTGKPVLTGFTAPKILWVRTHEPEVFRAAASMLLPKDFVRYRLTGMFQSDVTDASGTSLFDVGERRWSDEILETLRIPRAWLPEVTESPVPTGAVSAAGALITGLVEGTPVVAGAGDQAAEAVGCGVVDDGSVSITIGTSGVVFAATRAFTPDPAGRLHAYCHATAGLWHVMGVMLSAGGSLRWYRDMLGSDSYDTLIEAAAGVEPGCEGLLFLPYLSGERTPHADPHARGAFVGLTLRHGRSHLTRAVLEGITFGLKDSLELAGALGVAVTRVRVSGGGARSAMWRQLMADILNVEVATVNVTRGAAFGAALLAGVGVGAWPGVVDAARSVVRETDLLRPGADRSVYDECYRRYRALYPALAPTFARG